MSLFGKFFRPGNEPGIFGQNSNGPKNQTNAECCEGITDQLITCADLLNCPVIQDLMALAHPPVTLAPDATSGGMSIGPTQVLGMTQAGALTNGWVSSADWNTFNNKMSGSGTINRAAMFTAANVVGDSPWEYSGTTYRPFTTGSYIGSPTNNVGRLHTEGSFFFDGTPVAAVTEWVFKYQTSANRFFSIEPDVHAARLGDDGNHITSFNIGNSGTGLISRVRLLMSSDIGNTQITNLSSTVPTVNIFSLPGSGNLIKSGGGTLVIGTLTSGDLLFATSTLERAKISSAGLFSVGIITATAFLDVRASTAANSSFRIRTGVAPVAPNLGDIWFTSPNFFVNTVVGTNHQLARCLTASAVLNFPLTAAQTSSDLTIAVPGAALGDAIALGIPFGAIPINSSFAAFVNIPGSVIIRFNNYSAAAINPAAGTFKVTIFKNI